MFDINPETHHHHLAEIERQTRPSLQPLRKAQVRSTLSKRMQNTPAALIAVIFVLGSLTGGALL